MAAKIRVKVHSKGIAALLKSDDLRNDMLRRGEAVAVAAGDGFEVEAIYGDRVSAIVRPDRSEAFDAVREDSTVLTRAIGAAGG